MEFQTADGEWKCFMADLMPQLLQNEVKKCSRAFREAQKCLTPEDLKKSSAKLPI